MRLSTIAYGSDADQDILRQIAQATQAAEYDSPKPDTINQGRTA